jgi:glycosyltransferase involved in cell wall biosynthesis
MTPPGREPLVTVAIVAYNQQDLIGPCLESFFAQDYRNLQIVVADDASPDGTVAAARRAAKKAKRDVEVLASSTNRGITGNLNQLLPACRGEYVAFIGGDDLAYPGKIRAQVEALEANPAASLCHHDVEVFSTRPGEGRPFSERVPPRGATARDLVRNGNFVAAPSLMVRRALLPERLPEEVPRSSDYLINILAARHGPIVYVPRVLGGYRQHPASITASGQTRHDEFLTLAYLEATLPEFLADVRWRRASLFARLAYRHERGDRRASARYARAALRLRKRWPPRELLRLGFLSLR